MQLLVEESPTGRLLGELVRATGVDAGHVLSLVKSNADLFFHAPTGRAFSKRWLGTKRTELIEWLRKFHAANPSASGAPISSARLDLSPEIAAILTDGFPAVRVHGDFIALTSHRAVFNDQESRALSTIENAFRQAGYQPPQIDEVLRSAAPDPKKGRALLELLVKDKKLVRIADGLIFHADVITHVRSSLSAHKGRRFSVPEFKEWTQMSRKYAIPVLEYLDREKVTRRDGDQRVIV
jgi:selenocysteine-specific elongation factor